MNKSKSLTNTIVMISPDYFGFNLQTSKSNYFQNRPRHSIRQVRKEANFEFNNMVITLMHEGIDVIILHSLENSDTPDSVFPNNWFSTHSSGELVLYPMLTINRRLERQDKILIKRLNQEKINYKKKIDLTKFEDENLILEGTGSIVLDRGNKIAYAMESPRTDEKLFNHWCKKLNYEGFFFHAYDKNKLPIYHTNVLMSVGDKFIIYCEEAIGNHDELEAFKKLAKKTRKELIPISLNQIYSFCGNILQLESKAGGKIIVMSRKAYNGFTNKQKKKLEEYGKLVAVDIPTIETIGGGSARCMIAEIF